MLFLFKKSQLPLFEQPVHIAGSVRKDGVYVKPHVRLVRVKMEPAKHVQASLFDDTPAAPAKPAKETKLDTFIRKKGGLRALGSIIATFDHDQQLKLFEEMAKLGNTTPEDVAAMFSNVYEQEPAKGETPDLFADAAHISEPEKAPEVKPTPAELALEKVRAKVRDMGGKAAVAKIMNANPQKARELASQMSQLMGVDTALIWEELGIKPVNNGVSREPVGGFTEADRVPGSAERLNALRQRREDIKNKTYAIGDMVEGDELNNLPPGTELRISNEKYPDENRRILLGRGSIWFEKTRGTGWQKNAAKPQHRDSLISGGYGKFKIEKMGDGSWMSDGQRNTIDFMLNHAKNKGENAGVYMINGRGNRGIIVVGDTNKPQFFKWIGEDNDGSMKSDEPFASWGAGFTDKQRAAIESGDLTPINYGGNSAAEPEQVEQKATEASKEESPQEGERNADGLVFHDGRWHREEAANSDGGTVTAEPPAGVYSTLSDFIADTEPLSNVANLAAAMSGIGREWTTHGKTLGQILDELKPAFTRQFALDAEMSRPEFARAHRNAMGGNASSVAYNITKYANENPKKDILNKVRGVWALDLISRAEKGDLSRLSESTIDNMVKDSKPYAKIKGSRKTSSEFVTPPKLDLPTVDLDGDTWYILNTGRVREDGKIYAHLSSTTRGRKAANGVHPIDMADYIDMPDHLKTPEKPEIIEHTTGRGKVLRGVVRTDLTKEQAQAIDQYTFRKNGGWFIREKYLTGATPAPVVPEQTPKATPVVSDQTPNAALGVPFGVPAGTTKTRRREINAEAAAIINSGKELTDADRAILRQYSGNGGCGDSLNEFYTDPAVAASMWTLLNKLGVSSGNVLEPSCATGVFMHTAPDGFRVTGVEMDMTSSAIAEALHGDRHAVVNSSLERYAKTTENGKFDAVIGNAPFGIRGSLVKDDKPDLKTAEAYFLDTALDKAKAGGVVAMIVPTGVMDNRSQRSVRQRLLCKGEFLGAVRMPNTAFEHSHTEVTTDIVFFRKRPEDVAGALLRLDKKKLKDVGVWDEDYLSGAYFDARGKANVFGRMEAGWRAKAGIGQDITVTGSMAGVPDAIANWVPDDVTTPTPTVQQILAACGDDEQLKSKVLAGAVRADEQVGRAGDTKVVDGVTYVLQGNPLRWHRVDEFMQSPEVTAAQDLARDIESAINGGSREGLAERVQAYIDQHGIPSKNRNLMLAASQDRVLYRLIGAVQPDGTLSDVVANRQREVVGSLETAAHSLVAEHDNGSFTVDQLAARVGKDAEEVEDSLFASSDYAYLGSGVWTTMDRYLTGELWDKLDAVKQLAASGDLRQGLADKYNMQVKRLEETIDPKTLEDVEVLLNSAFVPVNVIEAFFNETNKASASQYQRDLPPVKITYKNSWYTIEGGGYDMKLLTDYLNRDGVRKDDLHRIDTMNTEFKEWLLQSSYRDQVEDLYNRKFRGFVQMEFSDAPIAIPGMNTEGLKQYQYSGLRWALHAGKGIIAADVGLGKTVRGLMLARMAKVNGQAKRPTFVVPKSVLANWVAEAEKWFPGSRVLVIGETYTRDKDGNLKSKADSLEVRNRKLHDMRQNDYDFIFISQPAFNDIDLDPITKGQYVNDDFWVQRGDAKGNLGDKRLNKIREAYNQAVANREFQRRSDAVYWNDLGVDMLMVDEAHNFKNLFAAKNRFGDTPKFLGGQGLSNRAFDMQMKSRYLREHNDGKGVYMLTATPTKNSPLEVYSMLSHVAPEAFERIGIRNSEEFLDRFCTFVEDKVLSTSGAIEDALVTAGFKNMGELREIMRRYIDRKTAADVGLKLPSRNDQMHLIDMTAEQQTVYEKLRQDMIDSAKEKDATGDSHVFSIMDKMGKAAMDLELLDDKEYAGHKSPKYAEAAKHIKAGLKDGGQVVFAESVKSHQKLADMLVKAGIPRDQIAIINAQETESSAKRQNIADAFNSGKIKVVIGNTATMGEGINLQKGTTDIHHLDLPWDPASMQQRNGRGLRQGNVNESVRIHTYLSKGSFDGYRYQSMMAKKDWQDMLWNGGDTVENLGRAGKFDRSDLLIMMSADPEAERAKFESDKAAAMERYDAGQRQEVSVEFRRLQKMQGSLRQMKNKDSESARRLQANISKSLSRLERSKYITDKNILTSGKDALIEPSSGIVLTGNTGLDMKETDGSTTKWVVEGVNIDSGDVRLRRWGQVGSDARSITVGLDKLAGGIAQFEYNQKSEAEHVSKVLQEQAAAKLNSLKKWADIEAMPSAVLESNNDLIQRQLKEGAKNYTFSFDYGNIPMIDKRTGELSMHESYSHRDLGETHDYLLPTEANKKKLEDAWIDAERLSLVDQELVRGARNKTWWNAKKTYSGTKYGSRYENPFTSLLNKWNGDAGHYGSQTNTMRTMRNRFENEQVARIRRAGNLDDIMGNLLPLAEVSGREEGYGSRNFDAKYPEKALLNAWARARHLGILNNKVESEQAKKHNSYALGGDRNLTVQNTLVKMALMSGHSHLAEAMAHTANKHDLHNAHAEALNVLGNRFAPSRQRLDLIMQHVRKLGAEDMTLGEMADKGIKFNDGPFHVGSSWDSARRRGLKFKDVWNEQMQFADKKEAA